MTTPVWISLGSNVGDRRATLDAALVLLDQTRGVVVAAISAYHETRPVGGPGGQGVFLNAAARLETSLPPRALLAATQAIENRLGRVRTVRWGERTLDIDLLIYGCEFVDEPDLKIPHPRLPLRRFVLAPLAEVGPTVRDPVTGQTISTLLGRLDRRPRIVMLDESICEPMPRVASLVATALAARVVSDPTVGPDSRGQARSRASLAPDSEHVVRRWIEAAGTGLNATDPTWYVVERAFDWGKVGMCFIVASPGSRWPRRPGRGGTTILWPEATEPDSIVAEVVAVCRGIEGV